MIRNLFWMGVAGGFLISEAITTAFSTKRPGSRVVGPDGVKYRIHAVNYDRALVVTEARPAVLREFALTELR